MVRQRLLGWIERWTGVPLTREAAEREAARQVCESLADTVGEVARRIEEERRGPGR